MTKLRRSMCLTCRTMTLVGSVCPIDAGHPMVDLDADPGALADEVWGASPPDTVRKPRLTSDVSRLARLAALPIVSLLIWGAVALLEAGATPGTVIWAAAAAIGIGVLSVGAGIVLTQVHRLANRPLPRGALPLSLPGPAHGTGEVVERAPPIASPLTGSPCVAYAVEASARAFEGGPIMLRYGMSVGFDVRLENGSIVRVPEGPLLLAPDHPPSVRRPNLAGVLGKRASAARSIVPYDRVAAVEVRVGDRVEVWGRAQPTNESYREVEVSGPMPEHTVLRLVRSASR